MKCKDCLCKNNCSLKEVAKDLIGCEGHGKERPPHKGEVKCYCCSSWVHLSNAFKRKDSNKYLCFKCY